MATQFTDEVRFAEMTVEQRDALFQKWGIMILNGDNDRAEILGRTGVWAGLLTTADHLDEYDAMIDSTYQGTNELIYAALFAAIDDNKISIFIKEMLDTASITIASGDKVQRIQGKDDDTTEMAVAITCNKNDVNFDNLFLTSKTLTLAGARDRAQRFLIKNTGKVIIDDDLCELSDSRIDTCSATPVEVLSSRLQARITRNRFQICTSANYILLTTTGGAIEDAQITDNQINDAGQASGYCIATAGTNGLNRGIISGNIIRNCKEGGMSLLGIGMTITGNLFLTPGPGGMTSGKRALVLTTVSGGNVKSVVSGNIFQAGSNADVMFEFAGADADGAGLVFAHNIGNGGEFMGSQDMMWLGNHFESTCTIDFRSKTGQVVIGGDMTGATLQNIPTGIVFRNVKGQDDRGDYIPVDGTVDLGSDAKRFAELWLSSNADIEGNLQLDGNATIDGTLASGAQTVAGHLLPSADDTYDLGSTSKQWKDGYFDGLVQVDQLSVSTATAEGLATDLFPTVDSVINLGSGIRRFVNLFTDALDVQNNIVVGGTVDGVDIAARDHAASHTVASHSDTTGTGAELETLTDGSDAGTLHLHQATNVTFAQAVDADWDGSADPGDVDDALDQLAERVKDIEQASFFFPVSDHSNGTQALANHVPVVDIDDTQKVNLSCKVPDNVASVTGLFVTIIPDTTETLTADIDTAMASVTQHHNTTHSGTTANATLDVTVNLVTEWDISNLSGGIDFPTTAVAGDYIFVEFASDVDKIRVAGLELVCTLGA